MPDTDDKTAGSQQETQSVHEQNRTKNWALFGSLIAFMALVFAITIFKMS